MSTVQDLDLTYRIDSSGSSSNRLFLSGALNSATTGKVWSDIVKQLEQSRPGQLTVDASSVDYCDGAGIGLFLRLKQIQDQSGASFDLQNLKPEYLRLFEMVSRQEPSKTVQKPRGRENPFEMLGRQVAAMGEDLREQIAFIGEVILNLLYAARNPRIIRWKDVWLTIETAGVMALPIIVMMGFLIGMIMAFQSALPLQQMGSDIFVADIVAFAVLRELGPLVTAIILAGRTSSAFSAEIGTMKVNEEISALHTMGLNPVRFLVISRLIAVVFLTPLLIIFTDFFGMLGGLVVFKSFGYSAVTYVNQVTTTAGLSDVLGGIFKGFAFGVIVAAIGCLRGLQTKTGASAVGQSTTSSVVTGIVLIILTDGLFSIVYYFVGI